MQSRLVRPRQKTRPVTCVFGFPRRPPDSAPQKLHAWVTASILLLTLGSVAAAAQLTVAWDDNSDGETGFKVERSTDGENFTEIATVAENVTRYVDSDLAPSVALWYRVRAFSSIGFSSYSNVAGSTTPAILSASAVPADGGATVSPATLAAQEIGFTQMAGKTTEQSIANTSNSDPTATPGAAPLPSPPSEIGQRPSRLVNLSVRTKPGMGDESAIVGFVIQGSPKATLLRAIGQGLSALMPSAELTDPSLSLESSGKLVGSNDTWSGSSTLSQTFSRVGAFSLTAGSNDAVILAALNPGNYTAVINGRGTGVALAEIYDADPAETPAGRLMNLSARSRSGAGDDVLIIGFAIAGVSPLRVLIRGLGPSLIPFGVSSAAKDPSLKLFHGPTLVLSNDDWSGTEDLRAAFATTGASSLVDPRSKDAALIATLEPGAYSVVVAGVNGSVGIMLAEVYEFP